MKLAYGPPYFHFCFFFLSSFSFLPPLLPLGFFGSYFSTTDSERLRRTKNQQSQWRHKTNPPLSFCRTAVLNYDSKQMSNSHEISIDPICKLQRTKEYTLH